MNNVSKVLVIGSGPIVIGQAAEFDYAGAQACLALKEEGIEVVLLNNNPATIMTDKAVADSIYMEPMTVATIEKIFSEEQPDGMIGTLGGQTGLNLTMEVYQSGLLEKHGVKLLGSSVESIQQGEDREKFRALMHDLLEPVPESYTVTSVEKAIEYADIIGYPVIVRPAYTLGGSGGGFASDEHALREVASNGLQSSSIHQILVEKSIKGWKEVEFEVIRDKSDTCVIVCGMENVDPVGVHTGDSVVTAPVQTLSQTQNKLLCDAAVKIIRNLGIVGACNIQFAMSPSTNDYYVIEVNPRVSRSSALASKATGCPIALLATKCALNSHLKDYFPVQDKAVYMPEIDYTVVKIPRFSFDKFPEVNRTLGTQMKATGETMAIDRSFAAALNKAIRSLDCNMYSFRHSMVGDLEETALFEHMQAPTDLRLFAVAEALRRGKTIQELEEMTAISTFFLENINHIVEMEEQLTTMSLQSISQEMMIQAKELQISDTALAACLQTTESAIREKRNSMGLTPAYQTVITENHLPYYYSTWQGDLYTKSQPNEKDKVLIIGSGPIRIGQGMEFDYSCVHAAYALKKAGYTTVIINNNPETVSTDSSVADHLYFEPLTAEDVLSVIQYENISGALIQFGGQTALDLAEELAEAGVYIYGTPIDTVNQLEDRNLFYKILHQLNIPHIQGEMAYRMDDIKLRAEKIGYPVLVRPSYVIGGELMQIIYHEHALDSYLQEIKQLNERSWPILIDKYIQGLEVELDCVSDGQNIMVPAIMEHIERAGVHSGDSIAVMPPVHLTVRQQEKLLDYTKAICQKTNIVGMINIQFVVSDDTVYVLEVNPRASRTVPMVSKLTDTAMVDNAVHVQLGMMLGKDVLPETLGYYAVKAPVFSSAQMEGMDPLLGPVMKSTGEILGLDTSYEKALAKATGIPSLTLETNPSKTGLFCSIADREKILAAPLLEKLAARFHLLATPGTSSYLRACGIENETVANSPEALHTLFHERSLAGAVIIPSGVQQKKSGDVARKLATNNQVALFTCIDTLKTVMECWQADDDFSVATLQQYYKKRLTSVSV
ncbi:carbamoyl-phosphate synthase (glutamine-hydrolyzing) large subunit [Lentibacillus cibarius]|uniref:Carbamoyl-phosphate synthase (Glutamine-hydrolyzing) large subunit n=1 Tax=Lentibacillus cibarius TaxID=2583219 RepID=A0A5S3QJZ9_9BACI|nr:carbamoyl-phosphate synthase (glutamine-hydrolyzing) large subunit [Lentibacillus cibarius]TMN20746.1 carbamoyl-phosphate synthase (glutamine-hydrolyzing) large subunit [Lentibacillus cibarius]